MNKTDNTTNDKTSRTESKRLSKAERKIYRFAMFGLSRSGKTCILTSLGMERRTTSDGSYIVPLLADRTSSKEVWEGADQLKLFAQEIKAGNIPQATSPQQGVFPQFRFTYTDTNTESGIGNATFDIFDYCGELINLDNLTQEDNEQLVQQLIGHHIDGIIVLTSVPRLGEKHSAIVDEVDVMAKVVTYLKHKAKDNTSEKVFPIAFGLTKWDLRWNEDTPVPENDRTTEAERLEAFFDEHEGYQSLRSLIKGYAGENTDVFPLSGLGRCYETEEGQMLPLKANPLESYGLPFVFGWLIKTVNDLECQQLEEMRKDLQKRSWLLLLKKQAVSKYTNLADRLLTRLPETNTWKQKKMEIKERKRHTSTLWYTQCATVILLSLSLTGLVNSRYLHRGDVQMLASTESMLSDPETTQEDFRLPETKLSRYIESQWSFWIPLRMFNQKERAEKLRIGIWGKNEQVFMDRFDKLPLATLADCEEIIKQGNEFLEALPNTTFRENINAKTKQANEKRIDIEKKIAEENAQKRWDGFAQSVNASLQEGNVEQALASLARWESKDEQWKTLAGSVLGRAVEAVKNKTRNFGTQFSRIRDEVRGTQVNVQALSNAGLDKADAVIRELNDYMKMIDRDEDKNIYGKVQNYRTEDACIEYLNNAPLQTMKSYVEEYKAYIPENIEAVKKREEWMHDMQGYGIVPPFPPGATSWEDIKNAGTLWTSPEYLFQPGDRVPIGTELRAEGSWWTLASNKGIHTVTQTPPIPLPNEPPLPEWRE